MPNLNLPAPAPIVAHHKPGDGSRRLSHMLIARETAGRGRHRLHVTLLSVAAAFAHDGLAAKTVKQFDEAPFAMVPVVEGCQEGLKFVLAFL